jgi:hypothetical protein
VAEALIVAGGLLCCGWVLIELTVLAGRARSAGGASARRAGSDQPLGLRIDRRDHDRRHKPGRRTVDRPRRFRG